MDCELVGRVVESPAQVPDPAVSRPSDWATLLAADCENLLLVDSLESTNSLARQVVAAALDDGGAPGPLLVVAREQTAGRGRGDRRWVSPSGLGVYASLVVPLAEPRHLQSLPLLAGVGLSRALDRWLTVPCRLKWPNDLLIEGRKIGGIRVDSVLRGEQGAAIVGFGVNWGQSAADLPQSTVTTSLHLEYRRGIACEFPTLAEMTVGLVEGLTAALGRRGDTGFTVRSFAELSWARPGTAISFHVGSERIRGTFLGLDTNGLLRLAVDGEELRFASGEVATARDDTRRDAS